MSDEAQRDADERHEQTMREFDRAMKIHTEVDRQDIEAEAARRRQTKTSSLPVVLQPHARAERAMVALVAALKEMPVDLGHGAPPTNVAKVMHHSLDALRAAITNHRLVTEAQGPTTLLGSAGAVTSYTPGLGRLAAATEFLPTHPTEQTDG